MATRAPGRFQPRMPLWRITTAVSAAAFLAVFLTTLITWLLAFAEVGIGGCFALGLFVLAGLILFQLVGCFCLALMASVGSFLSYRGNRFGVYLVLAPNLALMIYYGSFGFASAGQFAWAWILIALTFIPIVAVCLAAAQLVLGGLSGHVAGAFAGLLAAGLLLPTLGQGWLQNLSNANETPFSPTASAPHSSC